MDLILALSSPPATVLAVVLFLCAGVISGLAKSWPICLIAFGLAALAWPW